MIPLLAGILAASLAVSMINTALPRIADDLQLGGASRAWVVDAYPLTLAALIVVAARLGDRFGRRTALIVGVTGFGAVSAVVALLPSAPAVIVGRLVAGAFGALIVANVVSTIAAVYEGRERTVANGLWVATFGAANATGPVLGGVLTQAWGWQSVFAVCVPVALCAAVLTAWLVPQTRGSRPTWDVPSVIASGAGLGAVVYGITHLLADRVVGALLAVAGVALLGYFIRRQARSDDPLIDVTLFRRPGFGIAFTQVLTSAATSAASVYLVSVHVQDALGRSPTAAGLTVMPQAVATVAGGLIGPRLSGVASYRTAVSTSLVVQAAGLAIAGVGLLPVGLALVGFGFGVVGSLGVTRLLDMTPADQLSHAGALQEVAFALGSGLGIAVFDTVFRSAGSDGFAWAMAAAAAATGAVVLLRTRGARAATAASTAPVTAARRSRSPRE